jgi:hypothetical protein
MGNDEAEGVCHDVTRASGLERPFDEGSHVP